MIPRQVWKFQAPPPGTVAPTQVPVGAKPLSAGLQGGLPVWWAEVNPHVQRHLVDVFTIGTGWDIPEGAEHVGTLQDGILVWHVYVRGLARSFA